MTWFMCEKDQTHEPTVAAHGADRERRTVLIPDQEEELARVDWLLDRDIETRLASSIDTNAINGCFAERPFADAISRNFGNGKSDGTRKQWLARVDAQRRHCQVRRAEVEREPGNAEAVIARFDRNGKRFCRRGRARPMQLGTSQRHRFRTPIVDGESQKFPGGVRE